MSSAKTGEKEKVLTEDEKKKLVVEAEAAKKKEQKRQAAYTCLNNLYQSARKAGVDADAHDKAKDDAVFLNNYIREQ